MVTGSDRVEPKTIQEIFNVSEEELDPIALYLNEMVQNRTDDESISKFLQSLSRQFSDFKYKIGVDANGKMAGSKFFSSSIYYFYVPVPFLCDLCSCTLILLYIIFFFFQLSFGQLGVCCSGCAPTVRQHNLMLPQKQTR